MVRYIKTLPPANDKSQSVRSRMRRRCLAALILSAAQTAAESRFIQIRYMTVILIKRITDLILPHSYRFFNLFFQFADNALFKS